MLPIEERVGRRFMRSLPPQGREAMDLLRTGRVALVDANGRRLPRAPLEEIYDALERDARRLMARHPRDPVFRDACRSVLESLERCRRRIRRDH